MLERILDAQQAVMHLHEQRQRLVAANNTAHAQAQAAITAKGRADDNLRHAREQLQTRTVECDSLQTALQQSNLHVQELQQQCAAHQEQASAADGALAEVTGKAFVAALSKPQDFTGQKGKKYLEIRDWLQATEDYIATAQLAPTAASKIAFMQTYLKGEARRDWNVRKQALAAACNPTDPTATTAFPGCTFAAFKQALIDRWDPTCTDVRARYSLDRLRKAPTKPMTQFVSAFDKLCSFIPTMQDEEKIHRFLTSLDDPLAHELENDPSTKQRWAVYAELRRFALNSAASAFHTAKRFRSSADGVMQAVNQGLRGRNGRRRIGDAAPAAADAQGF
eukprot:GHRQ01000576.1.p2 GENE.GHRQ01000576.1~~GHRQ01000576.1.p2  ORF type:complete len:336 (+),score=50.09 GHRQ01000576.1:989-1996(+)